MNILARSRTRTPRTTYVYNLIHRRRVVYIGMSDTPYLRGDQHRANGKVFDRVEVIRGPLTRARAKSAEAVALLAHRIANNGRNPKYNLTDHG